MLLGRSSLAGETEDIARLIELVEERKATKAQFRQGKITMKEANKQLYAIKQEQVKINKAHGKSNTAERRAWNRKVAQAKHNHKQKQLQAARAKKIQKSSAASTSVKQPQKKYSQVHLPEDVAIPLKTTDVQGIRYGMLRGEAEQVLKQKGYQPVGRMWKLDDGQSNRTIEPAFGHQHLSGKDSQRRLTVLRYKQRFRPEIKFDTKSIQQALIDKYGKPQNQSTHPVNGVGLSYQPEQPAYNAQAACSEEMQRRGTMPSQARLEIHPMEYKAWQERGERDVKQRCPDQLNAFRQFMHFKLGVWASITANPNTKEIVIDWKDHGAKPRMFRKLKEEQFLKMDSGPMAAPSL